MDIMRQSACLVESPSQIIAMVPILITRGWVRPQTQRRSWRKAFIRGSVCLWLGPLWLNLRFSLALTTFES